VPILKPFSECIARPPEDGRTYPLPDHLIHASETMQRVIAAHPVLGADHALVRLGELAGFCHDVPKCHPEWQEYAEGRRQRGPAHAPAAAFLFAALGIELLDKLDAWKRNQRRWLWLVRDIADHHGLLKDAVEDRWIQQWKLGEWERMDLDGVTELVHLLFPELTHVRLAPDRFRSWCSLVRQRFDEVNKSLRKGRSDAEYSVLMDELDEWRFLTSALIAADRFDITPTPDARFDDTSVDGLLDAIRRFCEARRDSPFSDVRAEAMAAIVRAFDGAGADCQFFALEMPTGYGKTVVSFLLAALLCKRNGLSKIIYAAPYLSVLEQNSNVLRDDLGMRPVEHHSLAVWDKELAKRADDVDQDGDRRSRDSRHVHRSDWTDDRFDDSIERASARMLAAESWAHEIVCTSFPQLARAVFPRRAQDTLRRFYLRDAVLLIDEPQIFENRGWNLFLVGLKSLARQNNLRVIFLSATMPPFQYGLEEEKPFPLVFRPSPDDRKIRYTAQKIDRTMDERELAEWVLGREERTQVVILNTIRDACLVYDQMKKASTPHELHLLHGLMVPLHKKVKISRLESLLKCLSQNGDRCRLPPQIAVSTQVLEAGVDVSFQHGVRAASILPAYVQTGGRINRHFEIRGGGTLSIVRFLRGGKRDTRHPIYESALTGLTDELLENGAEWPEPEFEELARIFYERMFREDSREACKAAIMDAASGYWTRLGGYEPFESDDFRLPLFVPWRYPKRDEPFLPRTFLQLAERFGMRDPHQIYECMVDRRYWEGRDFGERKQFMALANYYILNIPVRFAVEWKNDYLQHRIPLLSDPDAYSDEIGFTRVADVSGDDVWII